MMLKKMSKIGATRCQMLRLKCTKFDFCWGSAPDPAGGAYSDMVTTDSQHLHFRGPTSKGREGKGEGKVGREKGEQQR